MADTEINEVKYDESQLKALMSETLPRMAKYMRFIGTFALVVGIVYCLTIIGAIFGIPMFFMGRRLRESAQSFMNYRSSDSRQDLYTAIERQSRAFFIQYVFAIISLVFMGLYIIILIALFASGAF